MKKVYGLFLMFILIFNTVSYAEPSGNSEYFCRIEAEKVYSDVMGEGWWDNGQHAATVGQLEKAHAVSGYSVCLRTDEWVKYDISNIPAGIYEMKVSQASMGNVVFDIFVDGEIEIKDTQTGVTGSYSTYSDFSFGYITIPTNAKYLTVKMKSAGGMYVDYFDLYALNALSQTTVNSQNIISKELGVGFSDNGKYAPVMNELEKATLSGYKTVCLRGREWLKYDVSGFESGTYVLKMRYSGTGTGYLNSYVDDIRELTASKFYSTGSYGTFNETVLGSLYIGENAKTIKFENADLNGGFYVADFILEFVSDEKLINKDKFIFRNQVVSDVAGEGFYDDAGLSFYDSRVCDKDAVIQHTNDWLCYDISSFESGYYNIFAELSSVADTKVNLYVDGYLQSTEKIVSASGTKYGEYNKRSLGKVYFSKNSVYLKVLNNGIGAIYLKNLYLEKISDEISDFYQLSKLSDNLYNNVHNEGFYDSSGDNRLEKNSKSVVLRQDEWVCYETSGLPQADFDLYLKFSSSGETTLSFSVDDENLSDGSWQYPTGDYGTFENRLIGKIENKSSAKKIKIYNNGPGAIFLDEISLIATPIEYSVEYKTEDNQDVETIGSHTEIYAGLKIENHCYPNSKMTALAASYDIKGALISIATQEIDVMPKNAESVDLCISAENAEKVKTFLWSDNLAPLGETEKIFKGDSTYIYVSAREGSDSNSGTKEKPLKTIEKAKEKVRKINDDMTGDIIVNLSGEFYIDEALEFTKEDSAANGFSIIYKGDGETVISGGKKVSGFEKVSGTPLYKTKISDVSDFRQFYVNENRGQRARSKWLYYPKELYHDGDKSYINEANGGYDGFVLDKTDFGGSFSKPLSMEFVWLPSWKNIRMPVDKFITEDDGDFAVTFAQPYFDSSIHAEDNPRPELKMPFYIENAPEFLDEAGEWYFDEETKELFYYPFDYEDMETANCYISKAEQLIKISGNDEEKISNITFEGIKFCHTAWEETSEKGFVTVQAEYLIDASGYKEGDTSYGNKRIPAGIQIDYGKNINFIGNEFSHMGSNGINVQNKTEDCTFKDNIFDDISGTSISAGDYEYEKYMQKEDLCQNLKIENNLFRRSGVEYMTPVITCYYVSDTKIISNDILDAPYSGISFGWGWGKSIEACENNEIRNNKIENVLYRLRDGGHVYTMGKMNNTVIDSNYFVKSHEWKGGIYHDNGSQNITSSNNVFEDCSRWIKITWPNIMGNTAYNNYSDSVMGVSEEYIEQNNIEEAIKKTDGKWCLEAENIIKNAGVSSESGLLQKYHEKENLRNTLLNDFNYLEKAGTVIPAGNVMPGGEGDAYHDITGDVSGIGVYYAYDGTGHNTLGITKQGEWTKYSVSVEEEAEYEVYICGATRQNLTYASVYIDDTSLNKYVFLKKVDDYSQTSESYAGKVKLTKGNHTIKVVQTKGNFLFDYIRVCKTNQEFKREDGFNGSILDAIIK